MIDPKNPPPEPELLTKVFPAGAPLASIETWWSCPVCAVSKKGGPPAQCMARKKDSACPAEAAA